MSEIKPVYQVQQLGEWIEVDKSIFDELYIQNKFPHRILYPAAAYEALSGKYHELKARSEIDARTVEALQKENAELKEDLQFVERWANHHGTKPSVTAQEALSCIQHYPSIAAITKSYKDGVIPNTRNPYAEIESLRKQVEMLLGSARKTVLALAHASIHDPLYTAAYDELSESIKLASKNGE